MLRWSRGPWELVRSERPDQFVVSTLGVHLVLLLIFCRRWLCTGLPTAVVLERYEGRTSMRIFELQSKFPRRERRGHGVNCSPRCMDTLQCPRPLHPINQPSALRVTRHFRTNLDPLDFSPAFRFHPTRFDSQSHPPFVGVENGRASVLQWRWPASQTRGDGGSWTPRWRCCAVSGGGGR